MLNNTAHSTFSDMPLIGREGEELLVKVDGMRGLEVMMEYVSAFADFVLTGKNGT